MREDEEEEEEKEGKNQWAISRWENLDVALDVTLKYSNDVVAVCVS